MQSMHDTIQIILLILSNPSWSGISSLCSLISIFLAINLAQSPKLSPSLFLKKKRGIFFDLFGV